MKNEEKQWDDDLDWIPNQTNRYSPIKNKIKNQASKPQPSQFHQLVLILVHI